MVFEVACFGEVDAFFEVGFETSLDLGQMAMGRFQILNLA
uniref:Uncharacterized protein n=1 Tax=Rhizophora mucronata TaxID=61149 RepID=A0A2P2IRA3_RHIMU